MANLKVDWVFKDNNRQKSVGWTESLYVTSYANPTTALPRAKELGNLRVLMLGSGVTWLSVRCSDVSIAGDSAFSAGLANPGIGGIYNTTYNSELSTPSATVADFPWSSILLRMNSGHLYRRPYHLSGNPDGIQFDNDLIVQSPTWITAFRNWRNEIVTGSADWAIRVRSKDTEIPWKQVTGFVQETQTITVANHGYTVGNEIRFRGRGFNPKPLGVFIVTTVVDVNSFKVDRLITGPLGPQLEQVRKISYIFSKINGIEQVGYTEKKRGGLSQAVRGRRRIRR